MPLADFKLIVNQFFNLVHFGPITNLELFLTESCNLSCSYCFVKNKSAKTMPFEKVIAAINFLIFFSGNEKSLNITLFGGEPLLEKKTIYKVLKYCDDLKRKSCQKEFNISITTNGTLITEEILARTQGKINYLLSIDGKEETHNSSRVFSNGLGSYQIVASKINLLKKYQPWLGARITVVPNSVGKMAENLKHLYSLGINQLLIGVAMDVEWSKKDLDIYENQLHEIANFYLAKKRLGQSIRMTLFEQVENRTNCNEQIWGCGAGRNTISVDTGGNIYPCSKFLGYESFNCNELKLGNIYQGITNLKLRAKMSQITNDNFLGCKSCNEIDDCMGGCPADNYYLSRDLYKPGSAHCELKRIENKILAKIRKSLKKL